MRKTLIAGVVACALVGGATSVASAGVPAGLSGHPESHREASGSVVIDWNRELLTIVRTPGAQPPTVHPTRSFAILQAAVYDAVVSVEHRGHPYLIAVRPGTADQADAAAAQAGHDVLRALYPAMASSIDGLLATELAAMPDTAGRAASLRVGRIVAAGMVAARADDGSDAVPPVFVDGTQPGEYRRTPPNFPTPVFTHWSAVRPFVLRAADQFRPPAPPALTSDAYARALNEVQSLGQDTSTTRTADQTLQAKFWNAPIQNYWNEITQNAAIAHHTGLFRTARLFLDVDLSLADSAIAFYDAKYTFHFWRPVTAVREADTDGNPATVGDPTWSPLNTTPADPSYPGAHSVVATAAATVLTAYFGDHDHVVVTSELLPGVTRSFTGFRAVATEAGLSRIFAGVHTRLDHDAGVDLGRSVAGDVLRHATDGGGDPDRDG